ncbi:hypothetical protein [Bacillus sp. EB600]|uniref:hypothetical protein n=1 Tax=Bacillus sp. EB600 TaxID=2806345 RepID=UPI00210BDDA7|nr:hypothetical protein [Bacillus sp. EB600]MCQ6282083.1 hypothetical protein [Bacillus sp. EB600]
MLEKLRRNLSDIPVREALKKIESDGLVENIPHVGSHISVTILNRLVKSLPF